MPDHPPPPDAHGTQADAGGTEDRPDALASLLLHGSDLITVVDSIGNCSYASPAVPRATGYDLSEIVGHPADFLVHPDDRARVVREMVDLITRQSPPRPMSYRQLRADGGILHLEAMASALPPGHPLGTIVINATDITDRLDAQQALRESQSLIQMVAEGRPTADVLTAITEFVERKAEGCTAAIMRFDPDHGALRLAAGPRLPTAFGAALDGVAPSAAGGSCAVAVRLRSTVVVSDITTDPRWSDLRDEAAAAGFGACWSSPLISRGAGEILGTLALYWAEPGAPTPSQTAFMVDVSGLATVALDRSRIEAQMVFQSTHDALTGLPNRALLADRTEQALARHRRGQLDQVAILFVDIDHFGEVNTTLGYAAGDQLLIDVAGRIVETIREVDTVARLGAGQFLVLAHTSAAEVLAQRIQSSVSTIEVADGQTVTVCIGAAIASVDDTADSLTRRSERLLREARRSGAGELRIEERSADAPE